jgi:hypothetical protein
MLLLASFVTIAAPASPAADGPSAQGLLALAPVRALAGHGHLLAAGTEGGVEIRDLVSGAVRWVSTDQGLPGPNVRAVAAAASTDVFHAAASADVFLAATIGGLGCGGMYDIWSSAPVDAPFYACAPRPAGGWIAGGEDGRLGAWSRAGCDSLFLPTRRGRIVGLAFAAQLLPAGSATTEDRRVPFEMLPPEKDPGTGPDTSDEIVLDVDPTEASFPAGLVAATERHGLWVLRRAGDAPRWLQLGSCDGMPAGSVRAVATDARGRVWIATRAGIVRLGPNLVLTAWPREPLLAAPMNALLAAPDGRLYLGLDDGVAWLDPQSEPPHSERLVEPGTPVVALAWAQGGLWYSDGRSLFFLDSGWQPWRRRPGASAVQPCAAAAGTSKGRSVASEALEVYDVRGRLVQRALANPSVGSPSWNGRDGMGDRVPPGVYFQRLRSVEGRTLDVRRDVRVR